MYKYFKYVLFFIVVVFFICSCSSTPSSSSTPSLPLPPLDFNAFQDNRTYRNQFVGIWTQDTKPSGNYIIYEFKNDGSGNYTYFYNNEVSASRTFRYKTSESQIILQYINDWRPSRANYQFKDNNTLSLIDWYYSDGSWRPSFKK